MGWASRARAWPSTALGLRGRIVGVLVVTTVATLAVAAITLLGPLEQSLRKAEESTLKTELNNKHTVGAFSKLDLSQVGTSSVVQSALIEQRAQLEDRLGPSSSVDVFARPGLDGAAAYPLLAPRDVDDSFDDVGVAFATHKREYSFGNIGDREEVRAAIPFRSRDHLYYVLAVRQPVVQLGGAVQAVRTAFLTAALAGFVLSLLLGIPLSARLVRRLRNLRVSALELTDEWPAVEVPVDRARDEVGDLARTLAVMQERLREQEEARRSFVATASHELRTPLTSLDGMLELLDEDLRSERPDLDDAHALLDRARAQSRRLGRLAADLLDLSRLDAKVELRSEPVELSELSRAVMAEFELGTAERDIELRLDDGAGGVWALGDPGSIARILRILLDNALRISPPGSELRIELLAGPRARISVSDQGPGVPDDERDQIFRRFHRGRDTRGQAGFGLGLAIGRELAERMGGELRLEPGAPPGARFTLELPSAPAPARTLLHSGS